MRSYPATMRRSLLTFILIAIVTISAVVGAFASFQRKRSTFGRIDFRFTRRGGNLVVQDVDGGGRHPQVARPRAGRETWGIGQEVPMIVERNGRTFQLTYRVPELKIDYSYLILSFIGFLYLAIGLFTLFRGEQRESRLFYFVTLLSFIVYVYTPAGDIDFSYKLLGLVEEIALILLPPLTLNFFLVFPPPILPHRRLLVAMYIPPILLALWDLDLLVFTNAVPVASVLQSLQGIGKWEYVHFAVYFTLPVDTLPEN